MQLLCATVTTPVRSAPGPVVGAPGILVPTHDQHRIQLSLLLLRVREVTKYGTWDPNSCAHVVFGVDQGWHTRLNARTRVRAYARITRVRAHRYARNSLPSIYLYGTSKISLHLN